MQLTQVSFLCDTWILHPTPPPLKPLRELDMGLLYPTLWEETSLRLLSAPFPHLPVPRNASRCDQNCWAGSSGEGEMKRRKRGKDSKRECWPGAWEKAYYKC